MLLETRWPVIIFEKKIKSGKNPPDNHSILEQKCKLLFTKTVIFDDKTDVEVHSIAFNGSIYNIVICSDSEMFSAELLRRLLLSSDGEQISAAAAVSGSPDGLSVKAVLINDPDPTVFSFHAPDFTS